MSYAQQILKQSAQGTVYHLSVMGENLIDFYYLLLVPDSKQLRFNQALQQGGDIRLAEFGRILHHGSGAPSPEALARILHEQLEGDHAA